MIQLLRKKVQNDLYFTFVHEISSSLQGVSGPFNNALAIRKVCQMAILGIEKHYITRNGTTSSRWILISSELRKVKQWHVYVWKHIKKSLDFQERCQRRRKWHQSRFCPTATVGHSRGRGPSRTLFNHQVYMNMCSWLFNAIRQYQQLLKKYSLAHLSISFTD